MCVAVSVAARVAVCAAASVAVCVAVCGLRCVLQRVLQCVLQRYSTSKYICVLKKNSHLHDFLYKFTIGLTFEIEIV